eukprot:COSAG06_NODE_3581_length_5158_cov_1.957304_4_plen_52_part_00
MTRVVRYNCALREAEQTVFLEAKRHNTGVVVMNASRNDRLFDCVRSARLMT